MHIHPHDLWPKVPSHLRIIVHDEQVVGEASQSLVVRPNYIVQGVDRSLLGTEPSSWTGGGSLLLDKIHTDVVIRLLAQKGVLVWWSILEAIAAVTMLHNRLHLRFRQLGTAALFRVVDFREADKLPYEGMGPECLLLRVL